MKTKFWIITAILMTISAFVSHFVTLSTAQQTVIRQNSGAMNEYQTGAVLWFQTAGENRALAYQAYQLARLRLDENRKSCSKSKLPCAVIVDVDETVLDNSKYDAFQIKNARGFNQTDWLAWCKREEASAISGAIEFLQYADNRKIKVFYVTNRREAEKSATAENLRKLGFPNVSDESLMVRTDDKSSTKEPRRQQIAQKYNIVMLLGDNLNDFSSAFENKNVADRFTAVEYAKSDFGKKFIVLPNPMYGDWESAIYDYNFKRSETEKDSIRHNALSSY